MDTVRTLGQSVYPDIALDISNYYISITSQENFCVLRYTFILQSVHLLYQKTMSIIDIGYG
jgi:hypothetical protein